MGSNNHKYSYQYILTIGCQLHFVFNIYHIKVLSLHNGRYQRTIFASKTATGWAVAEIGCAVAVMGCAVADIGCMAAEIG